MGERMSEALAGAVRLVALDVDGVMTDGGVYLGETQWDIPLELKRFDIVDGLGIKMMVRAGIRVVLVSGRVSPATRVRAEELGIACYQDAGARKLPIVEELMREQDVGWAGVAFLGDDLADLPVMRRAGLPAAVANAAREVREVAAWVGTRRGGDGAVREFAEALLHARGEWNDLVEAYCRARETGEEE